MLATATNALYTTLRKHGTTRQLAGVIITCVIAALLLLPAFAWYNLRFGNQTNMPAMVEVALALCYVALCGWLLPIGATTAYCLFAPPRGSTTALRLPVTKLRSKRKAVDQSQLPRSLPGIIPPFAYGDEAPWGWLEYRSGNFSGQRLALKHVVVTIGRDEACDIWLDDEMASRQHAEMAWTQNGAFLTDCNSLNGTLLNGQPMHGTIMLSVNDTIEIGSHRFLFILAEHHVDPRDTDDPLAHHTWRSTQDLFVETQPQETIELNYSLPRPPAPSHYGTLTIRNGELAGKYIVLDRPLLTVGRGSESHIPLPDASISRVHAQFLRRRDGDYVQDISSRNGTTVNNKAPQGLHCLQAGDIIMLGNLCLEYSIVQQSPETPMPDNMIISQAHSTLPGGPMPPLRLPSRQK